LGKKFLIKGGQGAEGFCSIGESPGSPQRVSDLTRREKMRVIGGKMGKSVQGRQACDRKKLEAGLWEAEKGRGKETGWGINAGKRIKDFGSINSRGAVENIKATS